MIKQDVISMTLTVLALTIFLYSATWPGELATHALFVSVLGVAGMVMSFLIGGFRRDKEIDRVEQGQIISYTALGLGVIFAANMMVSMVPKVGSISVVDEKLFLILIAIMEEQFFRGFLATFFYQRGGMLVGVLGSAAIFTVYHFAVYGSNPAALAVVFVAGCVLAWIDLRAQRVTPSMIAHILNNMLVVV